MESKGNQNENIHQILLLFYVGNLVLYPGIFFLTLFIEEGSIGGFGSHVANLLAENGIFDKGLKFRSMILPDVFIDQDTPERMYDVAGLNAKHIAQKVLEVFFSKDGIRIIK
jgi:1-deoxy-D-xylulose-5-phosphate synthase